MAPALSEERAGSTTTGPPPISVTSIYLGPKLGPKGENTGLNWLDRADSQGLELPELPTEKNRAALWYNAARTSKPGVAGSSPALLPAKSIT
ncbi:hypothetical protein ABIA45_000959 [Bradyrhizobium sp. USDA 336]